MRGGETSSSPVQKTLFFSAPVSKHISIAGMIKTHIISKSQSAVLFDWGGCCSSRACSTLSMCGKATHGQVSISGTGRFTRCRRQQRRLTTFPSQNIIRREEAGNVSCVVLSLPGNNVLQSKDALWASRCGMACGRCSGGVRHKPRFAEQSPGWLFLASCTRTRRASWSTTVSWPQGTALLKTWFVDSDMATE